MSEEKKKKQVILDKYNMLAAEACSKDSLRPALQKMAITPDGFTMATDGSLLAIISPQGGGDCPLKETLYLTRKQTQRLFQDLGDGCEVTGDGQRLTVKRGSHIVEEYHTPKEPHFPPIAGAAYDFIEEIDDQSKYVKIIYNPQMLEKAFKIMTRFLSISRRGWRSACEIYLPLSEDGDPAPRPVVIVGKDGGRDQTAMVVAMPMRPGDGLEIRLPAQAEAESKKINEDEKKERSEHEKEESQQSRP